MVGKNLGKSQVLVTAVVMSSSIASIVINSFNEGLVAEMKKEIGNKQG